MKKPRCLRPRLGILLTQGEPIAGCLGHEGLSAFAYHFKGLTPAPWVCTIGKSTTGGAIQALKVPLPYMVRGTVDGQPTARVIVGSGPSQVYYACRELWPTIKISSVTLQEEWNDD